jgi:hypothetical protein
VRGKIRARTRTRVRTCEGVLNKGDLHEQGLLAAHATPIQEDSTATGDLGIRPRVAVVGRVEQITRETVKRSLGRGINATATARRWRLVIMLEAPRNGEPRAPRRRRRAMNHRGAKRIAIRESAHTKETPRKKRGLVGEPEFPLVDHAPNANAGACGSRVSPAHGARPQTENRRGSRNTRYASGRPKSPQTTDSEVG